MTEFSSTVSLSADGCGSLSVFSLPISGVTSINEAGVSAGDGGGPVGCDVQPTETRKMISIDWVIRTIVVLALFNVLFSVIPGIHIKITLLGDYFPQASIPHS